MIINCKNFKEILSIYTMQINLLKNYTIFVFDDEIANSIQGVPPIGIMDKQNYIKTVTIFNKTVRILNESVCKDMVTYLKTTFQYTNCLNLDVNAINSLISYHNRDSVDSELHNMINDLLSLGCDTTCYPYIYENCSKIGNINLEQHLVQSLLIYNKFKNSSLKYFSSDFPNKNQDYQDTYELIQSMKNLYSMDSKILQENTIFKHQIVTYCLLLKVCLICFSSNTGIKNKITELMEFINNDLGIFLEREVVLSYWFLKDRNDNRIKKFFKAVQPNSKNIINVLKGMSWDLFHIRNCIEVGMNNDAKEGKITLHYLVTHDQGLSEVIDAYPIKFLICNKEYTVPKVIYHQQLFETIPEIDIQKNLMDNKEIRMQTFKNNDIIFLIKKLEGDLFKLLNQ